MVLQIYRAEPLACRFRELAGEFFLIQVPIQPVIPILESLFYHYTQAGTLIQSLCPAEYSPQFHLTGTPNQKTLRSCVTPPILCSSPGASLARWRGEGYVVGEAWNSLKWFILLILTGFLSSFFSPSFLFFKKTWFGLQNNEIKM